MAGLNVNKAEFIKSAASTQQFIRSSIPAIAFAGKSNVGKSSVINRMLNRKNFARVGAQPGKTIHVNYFSLTASCTLSICPATATPKSRRARRSAGAS